MKVHCLQHVEYEGLGCIGDFLRESGHSVGFTRFYEDAYALPRPEALDLLIIMGGPMSVNDESLHPWLKAEKSFVGAYIALDKPLLGICLGAQIIASCLGSRVYANPVKEIGWYPVAVHRGGRLEGIFSEKESVFHWHGETFDLPRGAALLAESAVCRNQAFSYGEKVVGLQFHVEATPETIRGMIANGEGELVEAAYIQSKVELTEKTEIHYRRANSICGKLLGNLLASIR